MSGITGIFRRDGNDVDPADIKKMNDKIAHRGPDGSRIWCEGPVAFGHQMLHTTPESLHETLPFEDKESGLVITADARIDNRKELAPKLGIEDKEHVSDSYFILKAYEKWGEKSAEELLGDFSFAIWNKNNKTLFCARDHMGVKPFYYYSSDEAFLFSTEIKALHCNLKVPYELDQLSTSLYLTHTAGEKTLTYYKEIFRLPSAHLLIISSLDLFQKNYWELNPDLKIIMDSDEGYVNKFLELFTESIKCRLRSSFNSGFELSGGLDSSSIVSVAKEFLVNSDKYLNTFSLVTEDFPEADESFYINKMIKSGRINPHLLVVDQISPLNELKKIFWYLDQPNISPNVPLFWNLYGKIHNEGVRVLISGYDGDSVLSHGQNYLKELTLKLKFKRLFQEIVYISKIRNLSFYNVFISKVVLPMVPSQILRLFRRNQKKPGDFVLNNKILDKKLNIRNIYANYDITAINPNTAKEFHYILITQASHQHAFEVMDELSSAFLIENRYPFFDKRLIEFCYGIPTEQKFRWGWDRLILRKAMTDILPVEIQWRSRKKFLNPLHERNLLKYEKATLEDIVYKKKDMINLFVDPDDVKNIYLRYKTGDDDYQRSDLLDLWKIIILVLWLEWTKILSKKRLDDY